jgi:hypothetical protein
MTPALRSNSKKTKASAGMRIVTLRHQQITPRLQDGRFSLVQLTGKDFWELLGRGEPDARQIL